MKIRIELNEKTYHVLKQYLVQANQSHEEVNEELQEAIKEFKYINWVAV